ncbi:MAG TPA: filamentous hemagglutinin N-terminal domain-containing protein, partial [Burkholderiaceae bacterium]|nr:filamentous hemagglutinin N-terminal domain-containing protein [Burkholderiaceae bacterium]
MSAHTRMFRLHCLAAAVAGLATTLRPVAAQIAAAPPPPPMALPALPTGLKVTHGTASLSQSGSQLNIATSPQAVLDWQRFNIGAGAGVHFQQAGPQSQVLNRVTGQDPSHILGSLSSNGKVWLINPNGVLFGQSARVDVAGLVASSLSLKLPDWLAGKPTLQADNGSTHPGSVINHGSIRTAFGGHIFLAAPVVANSGELQAPGGQAALLATHSVELGDTALPHMAFKVNAPSGTATQTGHISANQVDIHASVINQQGLVQASSLGTNAQGQVVLKATDTAHIQGTISADNTAGAGGSIDITAQRINVRPEAQLSANGSTQGGRIVLWGDAQTNVHGPLSARGGSGQGGFIETSTHGQLDITRAPDAGSTSGKPGTWLIDPHNITIQATGSDTNTNGGPPPASIGTTADSAIITAGTITTALNAGTSVTIATSAGGTQAGDITVASPISVTTPTTGPTPSLTLNAHNNININQAITANAGGGKLDLNLNANLGAGSGKSTLASTVDLNGGTLTSNAAATSNSATISNATVIGVLNATSGTSTFGDVSINGTVNLSGTASLIVDSGKTLALGGGMNWSSGGFATGNIGGTGTLVVPAGQTVVKTGSGYLNVATLSNAGTVELGAGSSGLSLYSTGQVINNTGTIRFSSATSGSLYNNSAATLNNSGTIENAGSGAATVNIGTLNSTAGTYKTTGTGTLGLASGTSNYSGTTTFTGTGITVSGFTQNYADNFDVAASLYITGGTANFGTSNLTGTLNLSNTASMNVASGKTLTLGGGMNWSSGGSATGNIGGTGGTLVVPAGQTVVKTGSGY